MLLHSPFRPTISLKDSLQFLLKVANFKIRPPYALTTPKLIASLGRVSDSATWNHRTDLGWRRTAQSFVDTANLHPQSLPKMLVLTKTKTAKAGLAKASARKTLNTCLWSVRSLVVSAEITPPPQHPSLPKMMLVLTKTITVKAGLAKASARKTLNTC